jgi:hypothetical protein
MLIKKEFLEQIAEMLNIDVLHCGQCYKKDSEGNLIKSIEVERFWIAQTSYFTGWNDVVITVIQTKEGQKGILLIKHNKQENGFLGYPSLEPIDLTGWEDPFAKMLSCVDVINHQPKSIIGIGLLSFDLWVNSGNFDAQMKVRPTQNQSSYELFKCLITTIHYMARLYNNPDINAVVHPDR